MPMGIKGVVLGGVVVLAAGAAAVPYYLGGEAEARYQEQLAKSTEALALHEPNAKLTSVEYQRGYSQSHFTVRLEVPNPELDEPVVIQLKGLIDHMPDLGKQRMLAYQLDFDILNEEVSKALAHYLNGAPMLSVAMDVGFNGSQQGTLSSPSFSGPTAANPEMMVEWGGLSGEVSQSPDMQVNGVIRAPGLKVTEGDKVVQMGESTITANGEVTNDQWFGDSKMLLSYLTIDDGDEGPVRFDQFSVTSAQKMVDGRLDSSSTLAIDQLQTPLFTLGQSGVSLALRNLRMETLQQLQAKAGELQRLDPNDPVAASQIQTQVLEMLEMALSDSPELAITDLHLALPDGRIDSNLRIKYQDDGAGIPTRPDQIIAHLAIDLHLQAPATLVRMLIQKQAMEQMPADTDPQEMAVQLAEAVDQQIAVMKMSGYIKEEGVNYLLDAKLADSQLMVNGNDNTPMLQMMLMSMQ